MTTTLALKADKATTYTTSQVDGKLVLNTNQSTTCKNTDTDNLLTPKATTSYVDAQLFLQADKSTTYTISHVDT